MRIIGERLNPGVAACSQALNAMDPGPIQDLARRQVEAGADLLDLNIGAALHAPPHLMPWLVDTVQAAVDVPLVLDARDPEALAAGARRLHEPGILNSSDASEPRLMRLLDAAWKHQASLVVQPIVGDSRPETALDRVSVVRSYVLPKTNRVGYPRERLVFDALFYPVTSAPEQVPEALRSIQYYKAATEWRSPVIGGISNISYGAPRELRRALHRVLLAMAHGAGLDLAIADPLDGALMEALRVLEGAPPATPRHRFLLAVREAWSVLAPLDMTAWEGDPSLADDVRALRILQSGVQRSRGVY
ncbi:MAG TPA: dihydropteroate synthase [Dehalococcoidia bacterium]